MARPSGIRRLDTPANRTHAWTVTVQRRGRIFRKYFTDGIYGSRRAAYDAVVAYRATLTQQHRPFTRREFVQIKKRNNQSGHVGISKYWSVEQTPQGTRRRAYWIATWTPEIAGQRKQRKFSIEKYGYKGALALAKDTRARAVANVAGSWRRSAAVE